MEIPEEKRQNKQIGNGNKGRDKEGNEGVIMDKMNEDKNGEN